MGLLLHTALSQLRPFLTELIIGTESQGRSYAVLSYLTDIILYLAIFFLPLFFIIRCSPAPDGKISFKPTFPKSFPLLIIVFTGCVSAAGNITSLIERLLGFFNVGFASYSPTVHRSPEGIIFLFIYCAVLPAITEEILFRKVILERLLPYGQGFAVTVSAIAFSLLHAHPSQFLYAFTAGLILGYVTLSKGSVLPSIILHFINNALSVIYLLIYEYAKDGPMPQAVRIFDTSLAAVGVLLLAVYLKKRGSNLKKEGSAPGSPPCGELFGFFTLLYVAYTLYLSTRWITII